MSDMTIQQHAQRLVIYIGEADQWRGKPLYAAILEALRARGLAGATVVRGVAGFGAHSRIHTAAIVRLSEDLPLRIEVVDSAEKIAHALEYITPMVTEGLITLDEVRVVKYTHRYLNPLPADRHVSEVMTRAVVTLTPEMSVAQAWERMLKDLIKAAPVVDAAGKVVGILTDEDLLNRAGLRQRLSVAQHLDDALVKEELRQLESAALKVADVMTQPVVTAQVKEPLGVAAARMAKSGMKRLPVVDADGKLVGVLSRVDILRQVTDAQVGSRHIPEGAGQTVRQVMSPNVPIVPADADLTTIVNQFVQADTHRLIVVDRGQPIGLISDADVVTRIQPKQRRGVLDALRGGAVPVSTATARELMSPEVLTLSPDLPVVQAVRQMLAAGRKWMVAVDEKDQPVGLVDRQALLRAITENRISSPGLA